ncbi:hypothetical protein BDZ91DRAFT_362400 [Kalaharituber pfeilii]|nr:hypothetical protein BDZ91DRAFT_362400 [Kalaharituber pfeilii]
MVDSGMLIFPCCRWQVGKMVCYYYTKGTHRAKKDIWSETSVQIWRELRKHRVEEVQESRSRSTPDQQPHTRPQTDSDELRTSQYPQQRLQVIETGNHVSRYHIRSNSFRSQHMTSSYEGSALQTAEITGKPPDSAGKPSSNSGSTSSSAGSGGRHMVVTKRALVERRPESMKLVIFGRPEPKTSGIRNTAQGDLEFATGGGWEHAEILVLEIDPYTVISHNSCCNLPKPDTSQPNAPVCCLRVSSRW